MPFDDDVRLQVLYGERLRELVAAGHVTASIYLAARDSLAVTQGLIMGYLDSCWSLPAHT